MSQNDKLKDDKLRGSTMDTHDKQRIVQEYVPGKQITLAHVIANPVDDLYRKLGLIDIRRLLVPDDHAKRGGDYRGRRCDESCRRRDRFS